MKKTVISFSAMAILSIGLIYTVKSGTLNVHNRSGKYVKSGAPGETTCSDAGCHGAGDGGLDDNLGSGSVSIMASPSFANNTYVPGQTYTITVTVAETGKASFGFNFEALDNSGNTSLKTNTSVGTISNGTLTQSAKFLSTGRLGVTHKAPLIKADQGQFTFTWVAPASGTINMYASGNAANNNQVPDSEDNIYTTQLQLTPQNTTAINDDLINKYKLSITPNPVINEAFINVSTNKTENVSISVIDISGAEILQESFYDVYGNYKFDLNFIQLKPGIYFAKISIAGETATLKFIKK